MFELKIILKILTDSIEKRKTEGTIMLDNYYAKTTIMLDSGILRN